MELLRRGTVDFYSFSYYMTNCVTGQKDAAQVSGNIMGGAKNPYLEASEWNWQIDPVGLRYTLNHVYDRYGLPIMITENGLGAHDTAGGRPGHDDYRIAYLKAHIEQMRLAIDDGVELVGYTPLERHRPGQRFHRRGGKTLRLCLCGQGQRRQRHHAALQEGQLLLVQKRHRTNGETL